MKHSIKTFFIISFCLLFVLVPILAQAQMITLGIAGATILSKLSQAVGGNQESINIGSAIFSILALMVSAVAQAILSISSSLLTWVISPDFIGPTIQDNPVVQIGWETVRNLANAALVFGLVAIAISIIVGYQETKAKQTLINFIGVALLINFTPVLCGVVIDFANKLMELFLNNGSISPDIVKNISEGLLSSSFTSQSIVTPVAYLLFSLLASVICFLYAFIFIARHVVLWILVIVSPIAFASKVFPKGEYVKKVFPSITYWNEWWSSFLQWAIIGIPASFSIYLSNVIIKHTSLVSTPSGPLGDASDLIKLIVPFGFLIVGFFVTVSSGGQIAEMATGYGRQAFGKLAAAGTGFAAGAYTGAKTQATLAKDESFAKRAAYTLGGGMYGGVKTGVKEAMTAKIDEKSKVASTAGLAGMMKYPFDREETKQWVTRRKEDIGIEKPGTAEGMKQKQFESFKGPMGNLKTEDIRKIATSTPYTPEENIKKYQALRILMERNDLEDNEIDFLTKNTDQAEKYGLKMKDLAKFAPEQAEKMTGGRQTTASIMSKMNPKEKQEKIRPVSLENISVQAGLRRNDRDYFDKYGTSQQKDSLQKPLKNFNFEEHIAPIDPNQIENLFKGLNAEEKNLIKSNAAAWSAQGAAKIDELDNLISGLPPAARAEAQNTRDQLVKKMDAVFNNLV